MLMMDLYQLSTARSQGGLDVLKRNLISLPRRRSTERNAHLSEDPVAEAAESNSGAIKAAMDGRKGKLAELGNRRGR